MINLKEIKVKNFWEVISLKVAAGQTVASNVVSLAQTYVHHEFTPFAIYKDEILVGFLMYTINHEERRYEIDRIMIDEKYQKKGYGKETMETLIEIFKQKNEYSKIVLSVRKTNTGAIQLYKKLGFNFNGELVDDEDEMELNI